MGTVERAGLKSGHVAQEATFASRTVGRRSAGESLYGALLAMSASQSGVPADIGFI